MHHSFVRRDRKVNDEWEDREDKNNGKGKSNHGKAGQEDWGIATSERNKGKGGGKAESHDDFGKGGKAGKGDKGYNFEGKGRSNSKGWRNMWEAEQWAQDHSAWGAWGSRGYGDTWNDWEDEDYDEDVPQYRSRQQESSRKGRYDQSENWWEKAEPDRKGRKSKGWDQDGEDPSSRHSYDDRNGSPSRKSNQWYKQEQDTGSSMHGSFGGDVVSSPWLLTAAADVYKKIKACQALEVLKRSLSPGKVAEPEWLQIAQIGSHNMYQACVQRSSLAVGSMLGSEGNAIQELNMMCAGQFGLASTFRHLQLHRLFPPQFMPDDRDDVKCASILAAIYGDLLDVPMEGETPARENARRVAEWALLDFIFLLGLTRLSFGFQPMAHGVPGNPMLGEAF
jgi:hypothetical protein